MRNFLSVLLLCVCSASHAANVTIKANAQTLKADDLNWMIADIGTIEIQFYEDKTLVTNFTSKTPFLWFGTNALASDAIAEITGTTGTNVFSIVATNLSVAAPYFPGYWTYGVGLNNKTYGIGKLYTKPNPRATAGTFIPTVFDTSLDASSLTSWAGVTNLGILAGTNLVWSDGTSGRMYLNVDGDVARDTELVAASNGLITAYTAADTTLSNSVWSTFLKLAGDTMTGDLDMGGNALLNATNTLPTSYITGCWPNYVDTDTVSVTNGDGYCAGKYFRITNAISHDMTSLASAEDIHYIYLDYSASTFPHGITIIDVTNEPAYNAAYAGWYNGNDRLLGAVYSASGNATVWPTSVNDGRFYLVSNITSVSSWNPDGTWQTPTIEGDSIFPVGTKRALAKITNSDGSDAVTVGVMSLERYTEVAAAGYSAGAIWHFGECGQQSYNNAGIVAWIALGPSRKLRIYGDDNDNNSMAMNLRGWEMQR